MISRKEIIIPSPRARRNTFHGNAVRIDRREKEGGRGGEEQRGGRSLEKLRQGKERASFLLQPSSLS